MAGSNQATNLTGMLNQIGNTLGRERDISSLTRGIENMSRPSGMFGGPAPGTDEYDEQLTNWQTKMGRTQEAAVTQANLKQRQAAETARVANAIAAGERADELLLDSTAAQAEKGYALMEQAAIDQDEGMWREGFNIVNDLKKNSSTVGQSNYYKAQQPRIDNTRTAIATSKTERDVQALNNIDKELAKINRVPEEQLTEEERGIRDSYEKQKTEIISRNPKAQKAAIELAIAEHDLSSKRGAAVTATNERNASQDVQKMILDGKSYEQVAQSITDKYPGYGEAALTQAKEMFDTRDKWRKEEGAETYVAAAIETFEADIKKLRESGNPEIADTLSSAIANAKTQIVDAPLTAMATIEKAHGALTNYRIQDKLKTDEQARAADAENVRQARAARAKVDNEAVDLLIDKLDDMQPGWWDNQVEGIGVAEQKILAGDLAAITEGYPDQTIFKWAINEETGSFMPIVDSKRLVLVDPNTDIAAAAAEIRGTNDAELRAARMGTLNAPTGNTRSGRGIGATANKPAQPETININGVIIKEQQ